MASNGLLNKAKNGKCRICWRTRSTDVYVHAVGEVSHGFATGHVWECVDSLECREEALRRIKQGHISSRFIEIALEQGNTKEYFYKN